MKLSKIIFGCALMLCVGLMFSCDPSLGGLEYELPEAGSKADDTPPTASFSATEDAANYLAWTFGNASNNATSYAWNFGDGSSSTSTDGSHTYAADGTYTVTLTATDGLGQSDTFSMDIVVEPPPAPPTPDPTLLNPTFDKLPKSSGSDCACSGWINKSIGDQGESSSANSSDVLKFDNNEPDAIYQEFEVVPNADYIMEFLSSFKSLTSGGTFPSMLEVRILAGSGYDSGYTPTYYTSTTAIPQDGFGYSSVAQVETAANNILTSVIVNPNDTGYLSNIFPFNVGNNTSVALFIRGIGGPATGGGGGSFGYNSGDEEIRIENLTIVAN